MIWLLLSNCFGFSSIKMFSVLLHQLHAFCSVVLLSVWLALFLRNVAELSISDKHNSIFAGAQRNTWAANWQNVSQFASQQKVGHHLSSCRFVCCSWQESNACHWRNFALTLSVLFEWQVTSGMTNCLDLKRVKQTCFRGTLEWLHAWTGFVDDDDDTHNGLIDKWSLDKDCLVWNFRVSSVFTRLEEASWNWLCSVFRLQLITNQTTTKHIARTDPYVFFFFYDQTHNWFVLGQIIM